MKEGKIKPERLDLTKLRRMMIQPDMVDEVLDEGSPIRQLLEHKRQNYTIVFKDLKWDDPRIMQLVGAFPGAVVVETRLPEGIRDVRVPHYQVKRATVKGRRSYRKR